MKDHVLNEYVRALQARQIHGSLYGHDKTILDLLEELQGFRKAAVETRITSAIELTEEDMKRFRQVRAEYIGDMVLEKADPLETGHGQLLWLLRHCQRVDFSRSVSGATLFKVMAVYDTTDGKLRECWAEEATPDTAIRQVFEQVLYGKA